MKCQICRDEEAQWAWQPFGPGETANEYTLLGSHARGFPVIKVGDLCRSAFQTGDFIVKFEYKGHHYIGKDHQVREVEAVLWLGESHKTSELNDSVPVRAIMRDTPQGTDIAALVFEDSADLILTFRAAPQLLTACEELDKLRDKISFYLERGVDAGRVDKDYYQQIMMALAKVHLALKAARGED
jgi:hypothetical protein